MQRHIPLVPKDPNGHVRVLCIDRVSTLRQSLDALDAFRLNVETFLRLICQSEAQVQHLNERVSGMLDNRATLQEAISEIESRSWDLVVTEDLSRIHRSQQIAIALVRRCVDHDARLICIGDNLDTAEENVT